MTPALIAALVVSGLALAGRPALAESIAFDPAILDACLNAGAGRDCVGTGVDPCITATPGGASTVGMAFCLRAELDWWDARLNAVYGQLLEQARRIDSDSAGYGTAARPSDEAGLRALQRAWIGYRDATCAYEELQWWGGTGAHGAGLACQMRLTGEQAVYLQSLIFD